MQGLPACHLVHPTYLIAVQERNLVDSNMCYRLCMLQLYGCFPVQHIEYCKEECMCFTHKYRLGSLNVKAAFMLRIAWSECYVQARVSQQRPSTPEQKHLQQLLAKESKQVPQVKLGMLLLLFAGELLNLLEPVAVIVLGCAVLCCAVLCCAVLCCAVALTGKTCMRAFMIFCFQSSYWAIPQIQHKPILQVCWSQTWVRIMYGVTAWHTGQ